MAEQRSKTQQVLDVANEINHRLDLHITQQENRDWKVDKLYEIIVIGNGKRSHVQRLDNVEEWIATQKKERTYYTRLFLGLFAAQLVAGIVAAAVLLIKLAPLVERLQTVVYIG